MKSIAIFIVVLLACSPAWPAQHIQRASLDFLLTSPEALDLLSHAEIWVFKSTVDGNFYTAVRFLEDGINGGTTRKCVLWQRGVIPPEATIQMFHHYTLFYTNTTGLDIAMKDWCIQ